MSWDQLGTPICAGTSTSSNNKSRLLLGYYDLSPEQSISSGLRGLARLLRKSDSDGVSTSIKGDYRN
jgi:hypothetical protein